MRPFDNLPRSISANFSILRPTVSGIKLRENDATKYSEAVRVNVTGSYTDVFGEETQISAEYTLIGGNTVLRCYIDNIVSINDEMVDEMKLRWE